MKKIIFALTICFFSSTAWCLDVVSADPSKPVTVRFSVQGLTPEDSIDIIFSDRNGDEKYLTLTQESDHAEVEVRLNKNTSHLAPWIARMETWSMTKDRPSAQFAVQAIQGNETLKSIEKSFEMDFFKYTKSYKNHYVASDTILFTDKDWK